MTGKTTTTDTAGTTQVTKNRSRKPEGGKVAAKSKTSATPEAKALKRASSPASAELKVEPTPSKKRISVKKTTTPAVPKAAAQAKRDVLENLGSLPYTYGSDTIYLVAQEPHWLFTYWDIDISRHPGGPCHLRVELADGTVDHEIEVPFESRNWYIPVKKAGVSYAVDIGFYRAGSWNSLARSAVVTTPRDTFSPSEDFRFATVPLHIGFHKLVETISRSLGGASDLVPALSSMAMALPASESSAAPLEAAERELLVTLLGSDFFGWLSSGAWSSEEIHSAVQQRLMAQAGSGELAELVGRIQLAQAESSLFSSIGALAGESVAGSWNIGAMGSEQLATGVSSWLTAALASWAGAAQSSWASSAAGSWTGGNLSSAAVPSSWSGAETSGAGASWGGLSSWAAGGGASWGGIGLSSLEMSVLSSWSEALFSSMGQSSPSSWGGSDQSSWFSAPDGVHAEITLKGRGEPGGRLRIGDATVHVDVNGDFEHRVVLQGGRREVSIRAISAGEAAELHQ